MTEQESKAQQLIYSEAAKRGLALFGGSFDPSVLQNMKSSQSSSFADEYEQMLQPYIGTEWEKVLRSNPYLVDDYQTTQWDLFSEGLGLWSSPRQHAVNSRLENARKWFSDKVAEIATTEHNSKSNQVQESFLAGQNPDLAGISDSAGMMDEPAPAEGTYTDGLQTPSFGDAVQGVAQVAMSCFSNVVGAIQALNSLNLADSQIGLMNSQSKLASVQSSFVGSQIASTEASTARTVHDLAYDIVHRTFDSHDFGQALEEYGRSLNNDSWDSLPYADKVSKYLQHRAIVQASNYPKSIQKQLISQINSMTNPNADDFKAWLSQIQASASEGNLRNEQNLVLLQEYGKGFGELQMSMQRAQFEMNKEIFDYQRKLYKQFTQDGMISEESQTKIQELITRRKQQLVQGEIARLQEEKYKTLTDLSQWIDLQEPWLQGIGNWLLPTVSDSLESMIHNFGSSFGSEVGGLLGNPWKNMISPVGQAVGSLVR